MLPLRSCVLVLALLAPAQLRAEPAPIVLAEKAGEGDPPFGWTLSASPVDPFVNELTPTGGIRTVYLWLCHAGGTGSPPCVDGFATAQFGLSPSPGGPIILDATPLNGFINSGTSTCLELAVQGCPNGFISAAEIVIQALPGNICFVPCDNAEPPEPVMGGEGCGEPGFLPMAGFGLDLGGGACGATACESPQSAPAACCLPDGSCHGVANPCGCLSLGGQYQGPWSFCEKVECPVTTTVGSGMWPGSWGRTKARYGSR